jgi:hypothetical protein
VFISFTASPWTDVIEHVDTRLRQLGWHRHDMVVTRGQGLVPHRTLRTPGGRQADAFAFQAPSTTGHWAANSIRQPPAPKTAGCP